VALPDFDELHQLSERDFNSLREKLDEIAREYKQTRPRPRPKECLRRIHTSLTERHKSLTEEKQRAERVKPFHLIRSFAKFKKGVLALVDEDETSYGSGVRSLFGQFLTEVETSCSETTGNNTSVIFSITESGLISSS
jgi:hypothetical protein